MLCASARVRLLARSQTVKLPGDEGVLEKAANHTAAATNNAITTTGSVFTTIGDWWEDVRPGWIVPKGPPGSAQQMRRGVVSAAPAGPQQPTGPVVMPAANLQLPSSMGR